jgi:hypothetical protein
MNYCSLDLSKVYGFKPCIFVHPNFLRYEKTHLALLGMKILEFMLTISPMVSFSHLCRLIQLCLDFHEVPIVALKSKSHRPKFLLELTKEVGNFALQLVGALMLYDLVVATRDLVHTLLQKTSLNEDVLDYESETVIRPIDPDTGMLVGEEDQSISSFSSNAQETSPASAHPVTTVNSSNSLSTAYVPPALRKMQCSGAFELNPVKGDNVEEVGYSRQR